MVRTRSDFSGVRVSTKAPRKQSSTSSSTPGKSSKKNEGGGNPVCPRETPAWQKEITSFFPTKQSSDEGSSTSTSTNSSESSNTSNDSTPKEEN